MIGAGIYLVWPAFYTDVTDSYRLGRWGRIRTDLGGLYFNAVVVVLTFGWWYATRWDALLLLVATQILQMVQQLMPLLRFDGYHLLADLTGVPDLYHRIRPTLLGLLPHRWSDPENRVLKPWARAVITAVGADHDPDDGSHAPGHGDGRAATARHGAGPSCRRTPPACWTRGGPGGSSTSPPTHSRCWLWCCPCWRASSSSGGSGCAGLEVSRAGAAGPPSSGSPPQPSALPSSRVSPGHGGRSRAPTGRSCPGRGGCSPPCSRPRRALRLEATPASARVAAMLPDRGVLPVGASAERRLASGEPLEATFPEGTALPTKSDPQLAIVLVPSEDDGDGHTDADAGTGRTGRSGRALGIPVRRAPAPRGG